MNKTLKKTIFWTPRLLMVLFILFISMFALDVFGEYSGIELLIGLFMHLIPTFVLIGILVLSWKYELIGGILFLILGIIFTIFFNTYEDIINFLLISFPVFLVGILFLLSWKYKK